MYHSLVFKIFVLVANVWCAHPHKILMTIADITSHVIYSAQMADLLCSRGHDVTFLLPSNLKVPEGILPTDLKTITYYAPGAPLMHRDDYKAICHEMAFRPSLFAQLKIKDLALNINKVTASYFFKDKEAIESIKAGNFDFVIVDSALLPYFLVPYKLGKPFAYLTAECWGPLHRIPVMPSYVPHMLTSYSDDMDFLERVINFLIYSVLAFLDFGGHEESREFAPERPMTGFKELILNASLCLQLRDNTIDFIRPEMPDVIPVASLMAREAKPLPTDLQSYMDESYNGVILVSFGTMVTELPTAVIRKLIKAFDTSDYNIIFKYTETGYVSNVPSNVRVMSWVPQNDILAHKNLKLFITHCGSSSVIQTFYHGVPVIAFPYAKDQLNNAALIKSKGIGEIMYLYDFTSENLQRAIISVVTDDKYSSAAKALSKIYKDILAHAPRDPVYWIEHVIKHGDRHLRSHAMEMPMYQYLMIDVIVFFVLTALLFITTLFFFCRCVVNRICRCG